MQVKGLECAIFGAYQMFYSIFFIEIIHNFIFTPFIIIQAFNGPTKLFFNL
jgi:hypothetical protein